VELRHGVEIGPSVVVVVVAAGQPVEVTAGQPVVEVVVTAGWHVTLLAACKLQIGSFLQCFNSHLRWKASKY
jgi:hypothetical protein